MKRMILGIFIVLMGMVFMGCPNLTAPDPELIASTIEFADGAAVSRQIGSGTYTNTVTGDGDGVITYSSDTPGTATVNADTGEVTLAAVGTTVITASKAATATHAEVTNTYTLTIELLAMITVPAGSFQRDATVGNNSVITTAYRMSEKEITRAQFLAIMGADPSDTGVSTGTTDPVQKTNWYHAIAFCNKLSIAEGLTPVYSVSGVTDWAALTFAGIPTSTNAAWDAVTAAWTNTGYRLPTEMEWMWAAMGAPTDGQGGGTNTTGYTKGYAGSTETAGAQVNIGSYAWYVTNSSGTTHPAGTKTANELGLYDMSGNVGEWCWDWGNTTSWPAYTITGTVTSDSTAGRGEISGTLRVGRGGSWNAADTFATVAFRIKSNPYDQYNIVGFRVVRP